MTTSKLCDMQSTLEGNIQCFSNPFLIPHQSVDFQKAVHYVTCTPRKTLQTLVATPTTKMGQESNIISIGCQTWFGSRHSRAHSVNSLFWVITTIHQELVTWNPKSLSLLAGVILSTKGTETRTVLTTIWQNAHRWIRESSREGVEGSVKFP